MKVPDTSRCSEHPWELGASNSFKLVCASIAPTACKEFRLSALTPRASKFVGWGWTLESTFLKRLPFIQVVVKSVVQGPHFEKGP